MNSFSRFDNIIIAGVVGSGKSYTENKIIEKVKTEPDVQMVLIDPKKVELAEYRCLPSCLWYADDEQGIYDTLCKVYDLMMARYQVMQANGKKDTTEPHVMVFVDEMAFLMQSRQKKEYVWMLNQIALMGRAARIHLILCTQVATQDVIPACIRDNMSNIICLRQRDAGKYRYLLGTFPGRLPKIGFGYLFTPDMARPEKMKVEEMWDRIVGA